MKFKLPKIPTRQAIKAVALSTTALVAVYATPHIKTDEGRVLHTYYDIAGVATACDGETRDIIIGKIYTDEECDAITQPRALEFAEAVDSMVEPEMPFLVHVAFTRFSYNIGKEGFRSSTARKLANKGQWAAACEAMMNWVCITVAPGKGDKSGSCKSSKFNKKRVQGLANRRGSERLQCLAGANEGVKKNLSWFDKVRASLSK